MFIRNIIKSGLFCRNLAPPTMFFFVKGPTTGGSFHQFDVKVNYYKVMEVEKDATLQDINKAYGKLYAKYEKDQNKGPGSRMEDLNQAYRILSNERVRKEYNYQRFITRLDQKMQEGFEGKTSNLYPEQLTPDEQKYYQKFNRKLKYFLMTITAIAIFYPFATWKGGQVQHNDIISQDGPYPKRHRGGYLDGSVFRNQNQQAQGYQGPNQGYNQGYQGPNQGYQGPYQGQGSYQPVYGMNPPGVQVTGQFVED